MNVILVLVKMVGPVLMESINTAVFVLLGSLAQTVKVISSFDFVANNNDLEPSPLS